ncbi:MAG: HEAT repeat domain-containing protein [Acidobacteriota bacterium]
MRKAGFVGILLAALIAAAWLSASGGAGAAGDDRQRPPERVYDRSAEAGTLAARLDRALADAAKPEAGRAFWIGYSVERLTGENSHTGSWRDGRDRGPSVADILAGRTGAAAGRGSAGSVREAAVVALDRIDRPSRPEKKVLKELGIFLRYKGGKAPALAEVSLSDLDLGFDFEGAPLYWLGKAADDRSLALIEGLYGRNTDGEVRKALIAAAGCHGAPRIVLPFLEKILAGNDPDDLRKDAAFWIGEQDDDAGLKLLARTARADRSEEVREGAVFGISQIDRPAAVDEMISLARGAEKHDVRKQAVFWLGQMAAKRSGETLEKIAFEDADLEIQEQAIFALSELPGGQGLDVLIRLARTHPDPRLRRKAVFWLGESDDPRAREALIAIVKGK